MKTRGLNYNKVSSRTEQYLFFYYAGEFINIILGSKLGQQLKTCTVHCETYGKARSNTEYKYLKYLAR